MKNFIIVLAFFSLTGCLKEEYIDKRPADQVSFISVARQWRDTVNAAGTNGALRQQLLEKGVNSIKRHILDSLQLQFKSWEARVLDVGPDPTDPDYTIVSFGMNLDGGPPNEKSRYHSTVFTSRISKQEPTDPTIKALKTGDLVRIDGNFKTLLKTINIDSYNDLSRSKNVLDNPEFRVEISKVEKF